MENINNSIGNSKSNFIEVKINTSDKAIKEPTNSVFFIFIDFKVSF